MSSPRIALVAGEASGDLLGAHLITALKAHLPQAEFVGIGGPKMQRAGLQVWWAAEELAVRGYVEVLRHYRRITGIRRQLLDRLRREKPSVFIGIDAPDFNLWLEARLKRASVPTIHYVSPSVWAWRGNRVRQIARSVDRVLALFPFEPAIYDKSGVPATYVGHPLADMIPLEIDRFAARERLGLPPDALIVALLPGSRQSELAEMAELFIATGQRLLERFPQIQFLVPMVSRETRELFETALWRLGAQDQPFRLLFGHAQEALSCADAALVASGTATLEAALTKTPMVITYRMAPTSWRLMKRMRYQPWVGLPNILAGRFIVPELLQEEATAINLAQALGNLLIDAEVCRRLRNAYHDIHCQLRQNTAEKAAQAVLSLLH